jgi:hypothetical protein
MPRIAPWVRSRQERELVMRSVVTWAVALGKPFEARFAPPGGE